MISRCPLRPELMLGSNRLTDPQDLVAGKLDQLLATRAVEVIVLWIAVVMLVYRSAVEHHLAEEPRFHHFGERAVDRRAARPSAIGGVANQVE